MAALGVTVLILLLLVAAMPKRLSAIEYYGTTLFAFFLNATCDFCLNLQFNLYGYFEQGVDLGGYIIVYIVGPCISMLFLNFFPAEKQAWVKLLYILAWSVFSIGYETSIAFPNGMIYYTEWKWWYSGMCYPLIYVALAFNWKLVRKLLSKRELA